MRSGMISAAAEMPFTEITPFHDPGDPPEVGTIIPQSRGHNKREEAKTMAMAMILIGAATCAVEFIRLVEWLDR